MPDTDTQAPDEGNEPTHEQRLANDRWDTIELIQEGRYNGMGDFAERYRLSSHA